MSQEHTCPDCGNQVRLGDRFCSGCGARLAEADGG